MSGPEGNEFALPTRLARRRLLVGRIVLFVFGLNVLFALAGGWILSGQGAELTRFRLGFAGWAGTLFLASCLLAVPLIAPLARRLLRPPPAEDEAAGPA